MKNIILFFIYKVNATIFMGDGHFTKPLHFTKQTITACTYTKCSNYCLPFLETYGFSYDTLQCYCYDVGVYMLTSSSCLFCKSYTACDIRPVVINSGVTQVLDYVFPKTLAGWGGTTNVVLDLTLYSNYENSCGAISSVPVF